MEERRSELICRVCGDKASGKHYGVPSCDGCRGFFKRSIRRCRQNLEYVCKETGRCVVDVARRNQCQACRFAKCLQVNMRREAVQHERAPRSCVKRQPSFLPPDGITPLFLSSPVFPPFAPYAGPFPHLRPFPLVPPPFLGSCAGSAFTPVRPAAPFWLPLDPGPSPAVSAGMAMSAAAAGAAAGAAAMRQLELPRREEPLEPQEPARSREEPARSREEPARSRDEPLASRREEQEVSSSQIDVVRVDSPRTETAEEAYQSSVLLGLHAVTKMADRGPVRAEPQSPLMPHPTASILFRTPSDSVLETAAKLLFLAVRWAHTIPSFIQMSVVEQRALLEASWSELFVLSAAQWPLIIDNPSELAATSGSLHPHQVALQLAALTDIIQRFADLKVDHTEYACLRALVLFKPEVKSVHDSKYIEVLQDQTHLMLYEYVFSQKVAAKARFGRLLLLLSSLRTVSSAFLQEAFFRRALGGIPISHLLADLNGNSAAL